MAVHGHECAQQPLAQRRYQQRGLLHRIQSSAQVWGQPRRCRGAAVPPPGSSPAPRRRDLAAAGPAAGRPVSAAITAAAARYGFAAWSMHFSSQLAEPGREVTVPLDKAHRRLPVLHAPARIRAGPVTRHQPGEAERARCQQPGHLTDRGDQPGDQVLASAACRAGCRPPPSSGTPSLSAENAGGNRCRRRLARSPERTKRAASWRRAVRAISSRVSTSRSAAATGAAGATETSIWPTVYSGMQQLSAQAWLFHRREQFSSERFGVDERAQAVAGSLVCERPPAPGRPAGTSVNSVSKDIR